ncbi:hypothetical protein H0A71_06435 [Alcaligenaceae bacterium]|nr:hypothetical protein [Alcaligenaceae bacterium]
MKKAILILMLALSGCSYNLTLMDRGSSEVATGHASQAGNTVEITLRGKQYRGTYAFVQQGYSTQSNSYAMSGGYYAQGSNYGHTQASAGNGSIIARADDGSGLRCSFTFSSSSQSGMGECRDDTFGVWDLQISLGG